METSQLICITDHLNMFYVKQIFTERYFRIDIWCIFSNDAELQVVHQ